jgi:hypothetical protein
VTNNEWADKLEKIASAIYETCYSHELEMAKYGRERKVMYDDADYLRTLAKELRGEDGQRAHELGRESLPWR